MKRTFTSELLEAPDPAANGEPRIVRVKTMTFRRALAYNVTNDPNAVVGIIDGVLTRFLCKGFGAWIIGPSGIGKSVLLIMVAVYWVLGKSVFGMCPVKPQRVLFIQGENDDGDLAEAIQGIANAIGITADSPDCDTLENNLRIITPHGCVGEEFCKWLSIQIKEFNATIVIVDPLLSFAGIDVSKLDQCSRFLRGWLNPILMETGAVMIGVHHTGKPKDDKFRKGMTMLDYAYSGIGSSELVNWARAVMVMLPHLDVYELVIPKRGKRAGLTHPSGAPAMSIWMRHSKDKIFWEQIEAPEDNNHESSEPQKGGRHSKIDELMERGLGRLIDSITEPIGKNQLADRIEEFANKEYKIDIKSSTAKTVVDRLVSNNAIKKTGTGKGAGYVKS